MLKAILLFIFFINSSNSISYDGFKIIKVKDANPERNFLKLYEDAAFINMFRFLDDDFSMFAVHPVLATSVTEQLDERNIPYDILTQNLRRDIENEKASNSQRNNWFESYHTYEEMVAWLGLQAAECGRLCSLINIGESFEGRPMPVIKISGSDGSCRSKQAIWIDAGIHSREWISHTTAMYLIHRLIADYETDTEVQKLRNNYDWYILTTVNPDGYNYTWTTDRLWRKSRHVYPNQFCVGTDINRNFDFQWMTIGASSNPCSETFAGPVAFSEVEAKNVAKFVRRLKNKILFVTLHSYGQLFMSPWGYTKTLPVNYPALRSVGLAAVSSIHKVHQTTYTFGSAANVLYESSGTSRDWAAGVAKVPFVYTIELRDTNSFILLPNQIIPTGEEIWAGIKTTVKGIGIEIPPCS